MACLHPHAQFIIAHLKQRVCLDPQPLSLSLFSVSASRELLPKRQPDRAAVVLLYACVYLFIFLCACKVLMVLHAAVSLHSPPVLKAQKQNGNCPIRALAAWAAEHYAPPHAHRVR